MPHAPLHDPIADPHTDAVREVKNTTCHRCACRCGIGVHLRDGKLRCIDGSPEHPLNRRVTCGLTERLGPIRASHPKQVTRYAGRDRRQPQSLHHQAGP